MFCPRCGKEVEDDAEICIHCGRSLSGKNQNDAKYNESKTGIGVVLALFLGLIGLIIGVCIFPEGTIARKTFIKSWLITYFVSIGVAVLLFVILFVVVGSGSYY